jgi:hypothetical protein
VLEAFEIGGVPAALAPLLAPVASIASIASIASAAAPGALTAPLRAVLDSPRGQVTLTAPPPARVSS